MSNITGTIRARATIEAGTTATIYNISAPLASTEYSQALGASVKQLIIRCRGDANIQLTFVSGESGTKFITVPKGTALTLDGLSFTGTLYLQVNKPSQTIEVLEWT